MYVDVSGVFYYFNSILNPILYSLMSKRFHVGFKNLKKDLLLKSCYMPKTKSSDNSPPCNQIVAHNEPKERYNH